MLVITVFITVIMLGPQRNPYSVFDKLNTTDVNYRRQLTVLLMQY